MNPMKALRYFSLMPIKAYDESTRTQERYRVALWSTITNALSKGTGMLVMLISIKLTLPYLTPDRFGAWLTIASFATMLSFLDLGVGNALTNHIAHSYADDNKSKLQKNISGGVGVLFIIGLVTSTSLTMIATIIPWATIIKVSSSELNEEIQQSCILFGGLFGLQLFSTGIQKIFSGLQKAYIANITSAISNIVTLIILYFAATHKIGIYYLLLITLGTGALINSTLIFILIRQNLFCFRGLGKATMQSYKLLVSNGGLFFILQIGAMIGWGADNLIISSTLGATQVAIFGVAQKMFQLVSQPLSIINTPLWVAYADAFARKDNRFIKKTLAISLSATATIVIILGLIIIAWRDDIINYWTNGQLQIPLTLLIAFYIWTFCECIGGAFTMFLNGCAILRPQVYATFTLILISIPAKIFLVLHAGISGMIFGFTVIYLTVITIFYLNIFKNKIIKL